MAKKELGAKSGGASLGVKQSSIKKRKEQQGGNAKAGKDSKEYESQEIIDLRKELLAEILDHADRAAAEKAEREKYSRLQADLGYTFANLSLLNQALIHPSNKSSSNCRLSWIGDSVMHAVVSEAIHRVRPTASTKDLHKARNLLITRKACTAFGGQLGLGELITGRVNGRQGKAPSAAVIAEAFEAVLGAVFVDSGYELGVVREVYIAIVRCVLQE